MDNVEKMENNKTFGKVGKINFIPSYKSKLKINSNLTFYLVNEKPNWWWKLWQYLLFGFKWEKVEDSPAD